MSKVNIPLMYLFAANTQFQLDNPELADFMGSEEEQERMDQMFEEMVRENNESESTKKEE